MLSFVSNFNSNKLPTEASYSQVFKLMVFIGITLYTDCSMSASACFLYVALAKTFYRVILDLRKNRITNSILESVC